jgi:cystine transport system substrate-binding protein
MHRPTLKLAYLFTALLLATTCLQVRATDLLDTARARGTLKVAVEGTYPPFNFKDPKSGELTGFEVDLAKLLAARMGLKAEFVTTEWSGILAGLSAGKYDLIMNQVGITPKRLQSFDFSDAYTVSSAQLIVRKDEKRIFASLADLKGRKLGVGQGTNYEEQAKAVTGIDIKTYPGTPETLQDLVSGRIDAALNDSLLVSYLLTTSSLPIKAGAPIGEVVKMGIPMVKGNPKFKATVNQALADAMRDGGFAKVAVKWFGVDVSKPPSAR